MGGRGLATSLLPENLGQTRGGEFAKEAISLTHENIEHQAVKSFKSCFFCQIHIDVQFHLL